MTRGRNPVESGESPSRTAMSYREVLQAQLNRTGSRLCVGIDPVLERLARSERPRAEGRRVCAGMIEAAREIEGVAGVHMMAYRQEEAVAEIVDASGVLAGRVPWYPGRDDNDPPMRVIQ